MNSLAVIRRSALAKANKLAHFEEQDDCVGERTSQRRNTLDNQQLQPLDDS